MSDNAPRKPCPWPEDKSQTGIELGLNNTEDNPTTQLICTNPKEPWPIIDPLQPKSRKIMCELCAMVVKIGGRS